MSFEHLAGFVEPEIIAAFRVINVHDLLGVLVNAQVGNVLVNREWRRP
jgi:hypothetical protein